MERPRISAEELAQKLVNSRKIMKKVDTGDYEKGNINEKLIKSSPEELLTEDTPSQPSKRPIGNVNPDKINQSKLPDAIKKAMLENPITLDDSLDMNFVNNAKRLMEEDNSLISMGKQGSKQQSRQVQTESRQISESGLEKLIENTIRRVLDEKLTQILNAEQAVSINENLVIKVGDSLFSGKITKVKNTK
jgi:hypothetical protein